MRTTILAIASLVLAIVLICPAQMESSEPAAEFKEIRLVTPQTEGGMPLMQALKERRTQRAFSGEPLGEQVLSNLLWAACGVNRSDGKRTAPTAMDKQEIDVYVAIEKGLYLYDAKAHSLKPVLKKDLRAATGKQDFVADAPVNLVFVADYAKMAGSNEMKDFYSATDTGFVSQNVYLYCASQGLATVVRGYVDKEMLAKQMQLRSDQKVILAQTVGYPKK